MITIQVDETVDERLEHMVPVYLRGFRNASKRVAWGVDELERLLYGVDLYAPGREPESSNPGGDADTANKTNRPAASG